jgi:hypothetical protein
MDKYFVQVPIAGSVTIEVEAASREDAVEAAWARIHENSGDPEDVGEIEWEYLDKVASGNVCHAPCNSISAWRAKS